MGRLLDAHRVGRVDDSATDTLVEIFVQLTAAGLVERAKFRTFGCSACIAASSMATELLVGRERGLDAEELDAALGGLPLDKRYCAELVAEATRHALTA